MADPQTGLAVLAAAIGGKDIIVKVLGPTSEYLGAGLRDWTEQRVHNVANIFRAASRKLPQDSAGTAVPPRVLAGILSEGSYSPDPLMAEYFGGVLASSRSGVSRDDRGAFFTSILSRLSSYHIRAHYVLYATLRSVHSGDTRSFLSEEGRRQLSTFLPAAGFAASMAFEADEDPGLLVSHILFGLERENLIGTRFSFGEAEHIHKAIYPGSAGARPCIWPEPPRSGVIPLGTRSWPRSSTELPLD